MNRSRSPQDGPYNIGQAASRAGVSAKMARHYEALGLLGAVPRSDSGYRRYSDVEVHTLHFIRRARDLGFSMTEIAELMKLWHNRDRASADVRRIAQAHLDDLDARIDTLQSMKVALSHLVERCHGDGRPDCPILKGLDEG